MSTWCDLASLEVLSSMNHLAILLPTIATFIFFDWGKAANRGCPSEVIFAKACQSPETIKMFVFLSLPHQKSLM